MPRTGMLDTLQERTHYGAPDMSMTIVASSALRKIRKTLKDLLRRWRTFRNQEGHASFNFALFKHNRREGVSAIVRVRNEANKIVYCLSSILDIFDEIVLVDNESDDATLSLVRHVKEELDRHDKIKIYSYPFRLARFGPEHDDAPEESIRSAVYYSNWVLSHCSFRYVCKWDGDMLLRKEIRKCFREFLQQIQAGEKKLWTLAGQTVYRDLAGDYYLSVAEINREVEVFPYGLNHRFYKSKHWECLENRARLPVEHFSPVAFWELKFSDEDEFSHWSTTDWPGHRKKIEWANFQLIRQGQVASDRFQKLPSNFLEDEVADVNVSHMT